MGGIKVNLLFLEDPVPFHAPQLYHWSILLLVDCLHIFTPRFSLCSFENKNIFCVDIE